MSSPTKKSARSSSMVTPRLAFFLVSLSLGQLGDGLNIFQGIYLVNIIGWKEGAVGAALSLMGLTALLVQPFAGDWVDKATIDRRVFLTVASLVTAMSASTILMVHHDVNAHFRFDHVLIYSSKILEGIASSFIGPCLAALTLASFGPDRFDAVMASNIFWGHVGSVGAAVLAGIVAYALFPSVRFCFLVIGASALVAVWFVQYLPEGDPLLGRGFQGKAAVQDDDEQASSPRYVKQLSSADQDEETMALTNEVSSSLDEESDGNGDEPPTASSYLEVLLDRKTLILSLTGFFFHFANANVLLVLGELMGGNKDDKTENAGDTLRMAIPLTAGAIVTAQLTMALATYVGDRLTDQGTGRKPLFMAGLLSLPIRCALILWWKDWGSNYLLSTQVLDGLGGGLFGLIHPLLVADITFGTGRFNVVMGLTASCFGLGATLSNFLGQMVVEHFGHVASLTASLTLSVIPIALFSFMPETLGHRCDHVAENSKKTTVVVELKSPSSNKNKKNGYQTF